MDRYRDEAMVHCADIFYSTIGLTRNNTRQQDQVRARAALAMAMIDYGVHDQIAEVIGKDRTTICHIKRNHGDRLIYWKGYRDLYETAFGLTRRLLARQSSEEKLININLRIKSLQEEKQKLENQLNTQTEL